MKKYQIIYADPPWSFKVWSNKGLGRSPKYQVMNKQDIQNLPIQLIADTNCILFLWVTYPCLEEGIELIKKWGFKYKTVGFTWAKTNKSCVGYSIGLGYWTRANPEICLLATKGKPIRINKSVRNLVVSQREYHSKKPDKIKDEIVKLMGDLPRIELFARQKTEGWDVWGNEVESDIDLSQHMGGK
jgi:N6-adenosine-specific RNA methylase IME4